MKGEHSTLHHKAEHGLDTGVRKIEDIVRVRGTADLTVAAEAVHTGSGDGEDVEGLAGAGRAMGPAAASYKKGKLSSAKTSGNCICNLHCNH